MKFSCEDVTESPTHGLTAATCEDEIQNGDEEGVDCGGSCPSQCPSMCNTLGDCGTSHYLREDPEDIECSTHEYNIGDDLDICCIAKALCSTLSSKLDDILTLKGRYVTYSVGSSCFYSPIHFLSY